MKRKFIGAIIGGVIGLIISQSIYGFPIPFLIFPLPLWLSYIVLFPLFQSLLEVVYKGDSFIRLILAILYPIIVGAIEGWIIAIIIEKIKQKTKSRK